jgi:hypothetical protein
MLCRCSVVQIGTQGGERKGKPDDDVGRGDNAFDRSFGTRAKATGITYKVWVHLLDIIVHDLGLASHVGGVNGTRWVIKERYREREMKR